ncbi:MAG: hypothetical protein O7A65_09095 [Proteobacteria bacterium]|nr:hypothetical protein [Pseudomonadota bacterium]
MSKTDHLGTYAEAWTKGEVALHMKAAAEGFHFDDPNAGDIAKAEFPGYFAELKATVDELRGGQAFDRFMDITEVVVNEEDDGTLTAWCWWAIPGTPIEGSGLIKVSDDGVLSEKITYYTKLPA